MEETETAASNLKVTKDNSADDITKACLKEAFEIANKAKKGAEGKGFEYRFKEDIIVSALRKSVNGLKVEASTGNLSKVFGEIVACQIVSEGNNRFAYVFIKIIASIFNLPIPASEVLAKRPKIGFVAKNIAAQFLEAYDEKQYKEWETFK